MLDDARARWRRWYRSTGPWLLLLGLVDLTGWLTGDSVLLAVVPVAFIVICAVRAIVNDAVWRLTGITARLLTILEDDTDAG